MALPDTHQLNTKAIIKSAQIKMLASLVLIGVTILSIIGGYLTMEQWYKKLVGLKQEAQLIELSNKSREALLGIADREAERINLIFSVFPDSERILFVLQELEVLASSFDPDASVIFQSNVPILVSGELTIPLSMQLKIPTFKSIELLRQIERLPYVVSVTLLDIVAPAEASELSEVTLGIRLYVNDPFIKP